MHITELTSVFFPAVIKLANQIHGDNYLSLINLTQMQQQGITQGINASFVALNAQQQVVGYRLSFAAGQWLHDNWCSEALWPVPAEQMAYFKSVGVCPSQRGKGIASQLLKTSIAALQQQGATAGLAHIWRESPGNAAERTGMLWALERLTREVAAVSGVDEAGAAKQVDSVLVGRVAA